MYNTSNNKIHFTNPRNEKQPICRIYEYTVNKTNKKEEVTCNNCIRRIFWDNIIAPQQENNKIEWKTIPGCSRYEASKEGNIRHKGNKNNLSSRSVGYGAMLVLIDDNKQRKGATVGRMVWLAFNGVPKGRIIHKNFNCTDDRLENLVDEGEQGIQTKFIKQKTLRQQHIQEIKQEPVQTISIIDEDNTPEVHYEKDKTVQKNQDRICSLKLPLDKTSNRFKEVTCPECKKFLKQESTMYGFYDFVENHSQEEL